MSSNADSSMHRIAVMRERAVLGVKGAFVAHLIGFSLVFQLFAEFAVRAEFPYTRASEIPIRFAVIWLVLDRFARTGRYRLTGWDMLYGFLIVTHGIGFLFADFYMIRFTGGGVFVEWILFLLNPFFYFIAIREASLRRGYRPDIILGWMMGAVATCALLGLAQALDIAGLRQFSSSLFDWPRIDRGLQGPSLPYQARGPFAHANSLSMVLAISLAMVPAAWMIPKLKPLSLPLFAVLLAGVFATYSRIGVVTVACVMLGVVGFLLYRKQVVVGLMSLCATILFGFAFVASIYVFDIQRFKIFLEGEGTVARSKGDQIGGWYLRQDANEAAFKKAIQFPIFGVGATGGGINRLDKITENEFSYRFLTTNTYSYSWVSHGVFGLAFVLGQIVLLAYLGVSKRLGTPYRLTFGMLAVAIAVAGLAENVNFNQPVMALVNCMLALYAVPALTMGARRARALDRVRAGAPRGIDDLIPALRSRADR